MGRIDIRVSQTVQLRTDLWIDSDILEDLKARAHIAGITVHDYISLTLKALHIQSILNGERRPSMAKKTKKTKTTKKK